MKASDIPDGDLCRAIDVAIQRNGGIWANTDEVIHCLAGHPELVVPFGPDWKYIPAEYPEFPVKVVRAKADRLYRRGLISCCTCGCRGDFELVEQP